MPDAAGNIKGIVLSGKAGETLEKLKRQELLAEISAIGQEQGYCDYSRRVCEGHRGCPFKQPKKAHD